MNDVIHPEGYQGSNMASGKKKEIYTFEAGWTIYAMSWSHRANQKDKFTMALGSYIEEYVNEIQIVQLLGPNHFESRLVFQHPYPPSKLMFAPPQWNPHSNNDLLATTGDYLRLWDIDVDAGKMNSKALLNNNKHSGMNLNIMVSIAHIPCRILCSTHIF